MANRATLIDNAKGPPVWTVKLDTTGAFELGDAAHGAVGSWVLQITGTFVGSVVLQKKLYGGATAAADAGATWYTNDLTGTDIAAGVALTFADVGVIVKVPCDGCSLVFDYTATSGTMVIECVNLLG